MSGKPNRSRFWLKALLFLAVTIAVIWPFLPGVSWSGAAAVELTVHVVDGSTSLPISGATVGIDHGSPAANDRWPPTTTDSSGIGELVTFLGAGGERNVLYERYGYGTDDPIINISAPGYLPTTASPGSHSGVRILGYPRSAHRLSIEVRLMKAPSTQPSSG